MIDPNGYERNCCKDCCAHDGSYYRPQGSSQASQASSQCREEGASSKSSKGFVFFQVEVEISEDSSQSSQASSQCQEETSKQRRWSEEDDRTRKALPLMLPPRAQAPATKVATQAAWGIAAGVLANAVPNHFWTRCEDMWIDQNLKYRNHLIEYNVAWGLKKRKSLRKIVSYWGGCEAPRMGNAMVRPELPRVRGLGK